MDTSGGSGTGGLVGISVGEGVTLTSEGRRVSARERKMGEASAEATTVGNTNTLEAASTAVTSMAVVEEAQGRRRFMEGLFLADDSAMVA
jgi:hypothetical protein